MTGDAPVVCIPIAGTRLRLIKCRHYFKYQELGATTRAAISEFSLPTRKTIAITTAKPASAQNVTFHVGFVESLYIKKITTQTRKSGYRCVAQNATGNMAKLCSIVNDAKGYIFLLLDINKLRFSHPIHLLTIYPFKV